MTRLDLKYIAELVPDIRENNMNAFAELYSATCQKLYAFAYRLLNDHFASQAALEECYITALNRISLLRDDSLVVAWLNQIMFRICIRARFDPSQNKGSDPESQIVRISGNAYTIRRILTLPFTEGQSLLLVHYCGMKPLQAANQLELSYIQFRHYLRNGTLRLAYDLNGGDGD